MKRLVRGIGWLILGVICMNVAFFAFLANPRFLFAHAVTNGPLTFYATTPLDRAATTAFLDDVSERMSASVLGPPEADYALYSTDETWRKRLFFTYLQRAGGVTYVPFGPRNAFLTGADIPRDRLLKKGADIVPPRTLSYYAVHELTHLRMAEMLPSLDYHRLPRWVREGVPDFVALGPVSQDARKDILEWAGTPLERMITYGSYPLERVLVDFALGHLALPIETLISQPMTEAEIMSLLETARQEGRL